MAQSASLTQTNAHMHWTARVGFALSLLIGLLFLLIMVVGYPGRQFV